MFGDAYLMFQLSYTQFVHLWCAYSNKFSMNSSSDITSFIPATLTIVVQPPIKLELADSILDCHDFCRGGPQYLLAHIVSDSFSPKINI